MRACMHVQARTDRRRQLPRCVAKGMKVDKVSNKITLMPISLDRVTTDAL